MTEVAKAFVTIVPTMQGAQQQITSELTGITDVAAKSAGESGGSSFGSNFASAIGGTAAAITGALVTATTAAVGAAVGAGKAFIDAARETAAYGDEVDKTSQRLGLSAQAYQEWDYVLNIAGTEMSSMTTGLKTLTNQLDNAKNGSEDAQAMFAALGISMDELSTMSREDLFEATIKGFQNMEDSTTRAALANDLFGRSGQNLAPLFNMTAEETEKLIAQANEYGIVMSDDGVAASAQFTDSMTTMENTVQGLKNSMMANFLPAMSTIMDGVSAIFAGDQMGADLIQTGISDLISNISTYAPTFFQLAETIILALMNGFAPMMPQVVSMIFSFLNTAIVNIVAMIPQLTPVIQQGVEGALQAVLQSLPIIIKALIQLVSDIVVWLSSGNNVQMLVGGILELVSLLCDSLGDVLPVLLPAVVEIISQVAIELTKPNNVQMLLDSALYLIGAIAMALIKSVPTLLSAVGQLFSNIVNRMMNENNMIISKVGSFFTNLINQVKTRASNLVSNVVSIISQLPSRVISIGQSLLTGLWNGISSKVDWVVSKIRGMGNSITNAIKNVFGIHSPSKVWRQEIGQNLGLSVGLGFDDVIGDVKDDMVDSMTGLTYSMTGTVSSYGSGSAGQLSGGASYTGGAVTINVYGAEGQDENSLAQIVAQKLEDMTRRKEIAYA